MKQYINNNTQFKNKIFNFNRNRNKNKKYNNKMEKNMIFMNNFNKKL